MMNIQANEDIKFTAEGIFPYCSDGCCTILESFEYELNKGETLELGQEFLNRTEYIFSEWDEEDNFEFIARVKIKIIDSLLMEGKIKILE